MQLPREKGRARGVQTLSEVELLALILGSGVKNRSCFDLASDLITSRFGSLSYDQLVQIKGIGFATALRLLAVVEFSRRLSQKDNNESQLYTPEHIALCVPELALYKQEHCIGLYLDSRYRMIHKILLSKGTLTESLLHPREVYYEAIKHQAAFTIVAHNHPSGDPSPSEDDIHISRQLLNAGRIIGIEFLDHVIVAKNGYVSLKASGMI